MTEISKKGRRIKDNTVIIKGKESTESLKMVYCGRLQRS